MKYSEPASLPATLSDLTELAIEAAKAAGDAIMQVYNRRHINIEQKGDRTPVTEADRASHHIIVRCLESSGIPVLSEEGKDIPYDKRKGWEYFWLVDPLDGTKEFIKRNGEFTVNIALIHKQKPVLGVVYVPDNGTVYYASEGNGAYKQMDGGEMTRLPRRKGPLNLRQPGLRLVASRSHRDAQTQAYLDQFENPHVLSMGSSLKFMLLAEGKADIYPRFAPTMEWDVAAAHAILNETGHMIQTWPKGGEFLYNKKELINSFFLAV